MVRRVYALGSENATHLEHRSKNALRPNDRNGSKADIRFTLDSPGHFAKLDIVSLNARRQIGLILKDAVDEYTAVLKSRLQAMYADHSAKGRLHSGATVQVAVRMMDEIATEAVERMPSKILAIARDSEAYSAFGAAMIDLIKTFRDEMPTVIRMASGRMPCEPSPSIERASYELFSQMESKIDRKIEIAEFSFSGQPAAAFAPPPPSGQIKTGRPRGAFWDDMWAAIASDLFDGKLKPKSQADLEQAMLKWIEANGHSAAVSTVRARARRLWDRIRALE